ncbi:DEAD/DEAH box helicase domain protein [uncultured delta proteobacterium]|uniref:DEAD/DEAH box helicase domain protein n=1 Tax=uncultured delta proteobacterium TaxID=34034 RepID=A0A212JX47_9DELT|nr:DEAD/DEAH box helicase domain protein [uncultured delta proteobacterium]
MDSSLSPLRENPPFEGAVADETLAPQPVFSSPEENGGALADFVGALLASERFGRQVTHHRVMNPTAGEYAETKKPLGTAMRAVLERAGISRLYSHQALATDLVRAGRDVVVATPTASGKSLIYNLPVLDRFLRDPDATSIFLFPLKALAQDQIAAFSALTDHWATDARPRISVYDGDTSDHFRRKIRENPPQILVTNPDMLHLAVLPFHERWTTFLASLSLVVIDEMHTYRGVFGAHMAQVLRRLARIAGLYGARPAYVSCSATIGNPAELALALTGKEAEAVTKGGSPQGKRHFIFINPEDSPATTAIHLLRAALARNLRTIVYAQSRRMTELISLWAAEQSGKYASKISAYRAGFLPEERRDIEARMASGDLLAVISTSALELGIDIGGLDLCILVGYPGSVMATLQRGGRVGRSGRESAVVLIAQEDALDQYIVRNPEDFFARPPECAVVNPENEVILERHLECAAAEHPLKPQGVDGEWLGSENAANALASLENQGLLLRSADGATLHAARKRPQRHVDLRGAGASITLQDNTGAVIGSLDGARAMREAHPGAVYIHRGRTYIVTSLDLAARTAVLEPGKPAYYTRTRGNKNTEILSVRAQKSLWGASLGLGRLRVTEEITGYEKRATRDGRLLSVVPLEFDPLVFETEGLWLTIPDGARHTVENALLHFMGAIHAVEHAAIGIMPLLVMADRNDFGGISTPMHAGLGTPAVFIYDGLPGGAGLSAQAFRDAETLLSRTLNVIAGCGCETGCPSCVHSPKCGSGNRPIDKDGAILLLQTMQADMTVAGHPDIELAAPPASPRSRISHEEQPRKTETLPVPPHTATSVAEAQGGGSPSFGSVSVEGGTATEERKIMQPCRFGVLDVETRYSAQDVGGWNRADRMGVSVAVLYDSGTAAFTSYTQDAVPELAARCAGLDLVVGFNILRFDYAVLGPHAPGVDWRKFPTLDMLAHVYERLSYRLSLDNIAQATLNVGKSADGLQALAWWKEGAVDKIEEYCRQDVAVTRDIYLFGRENGYLLFSNKAKQIVRVPVKW